jgi:hypothetical protein
MSCWGLCYRALLGHEFHPEKSLIFWGEILGYVEAKLGQIGGWKATSTEACWVGVGLGSILGLCCGHLEVVCCALVSLSLGRLGLLFLPAGRKPRYT